MDSKINSSKGNTATDIEDSLDSDINNISEASIYRIYKTIFRSS